MNLNIALAGMGAAAALVAVPVVAMVASGDGQGSTQHPTHSTDRTPGPARPDSCVELIQGQSNPCNPGTSGDRPTPYRTAAVATAATSAGHACVVLHRTNRKLCSLQ